MPISYSEPATTPSMFSLEETPALVVPKLDGICRAKAPTCPDTSLPWPQDSRLGGWSARMFLHQMLVNSRSAWSCSDTELYISRSTLAVLRVKVGRETSALHALTTEPPPFSSGLYLSHQMIIGLARRAAKRGRPLQHVLQRTKDGDFQRRIVTFTRTELGYVPSLLKNASDSKDSAATTLLNFLTACVVACAETR